MFILNFLFVNLFKSLIFLLLSALETSATTEHVVAESGGEDSEDEWNYVKVNKKELSENNDNIEAKTLETTSSENIEKKLDQVLEENLTLDQEIVSSLITNASSLIEEKGDELQDILSEALQGISQGIAESQEICTDVS